MEKTPLTGDEVNLITELSERYRIKTADDLLDALKSELELLSRFSEKANTKEGRTYIFEKFLSEARKK